MPKLLLSENREVCDTVVYGFLNGSPDLMLGVVSVPQTSPVYVQVPCSIFERQRSSGGSM